MEYSQLYAQKLVSAAEAASVVKSGDWVDYGWTTGTPVAVDREIAKRLPELENVNFRGGILMWEPAVFQIESPEKHMTWNSWHMGGIERKAIAKGFSFYAPIRYSELPRYYRESPDPLDVAVFQVAPMDAHGYFNFGPNASHLGEVCRKAHTVIVEVNKNMPRCLGGFDEGVHITDVDYIVEGDNPPMGQMGPAAAPTAVDEAVAKLIVPQIPNGACLQLGIGALPNSVGSMLCNSDIKDLSMHTELCSDAYLDLFEAGKLTHRYNNLHRDKGMLGMAFGSRRLYEWMDHNPGLAACPLEYVNDPAVIGSIDNIVAINNCICLDLYGQVSSESSGTRHISGTGGQLDFMDGAARSKGGKGFIAMTSTYKDRNGNLRSRIVPQLRGDIVTTPRSQAYYIVTEYGIANLAGLTTWERAERLVNLAHPAFREELIAQAEAQKIWRRSQKR